jgi:hypothetical protein
LQEDEESHVTFMSLSHSGFATLRGMVKLKIDFPYRSDRKPTETHDQSTMMKEWIITSAVFSWKISINNPHGLAFRITTTIVYRTPRYIKIPAITHM